MKTVDFEEGRTWFCILVPVLISYVTLDHFLHLSGNQFSHV
jgi:hypothetical protein